MNTFRDIALETLAHRVRKHDEIQPAAVHLSRTTSDPDMALYLSTLYETPNSEMTPEMLRGRRRFEAALERRVAEIEAEKSRERYEKRKSAKARLDRAAPIAAASNEAARTAARAEGLAQGLQDTTAKNAATEAARLLREAAYHLSSAAHRENAALSREEGRRGEMFEAVYKAELRRAAWERHE